MKAINVKWLLLCNSNIISINNVNENTMAID